MILRRVIEHFRKQEWTAIAIDFLIVVVGVFIGLQVNNWNEARRDRVDEQFFLVRLHDNLQNAENSGRRVFQPRIDKRKALASAVLALLNKSGLATLSREECNAVATSHIFRVTLADLPAMTELSGSGRLSIVRNKELRSALITLQQAQSVLGDAMDDAGPSVLGDLFPELLAVDVYEEEGDGRLRFKAVCDVASMRENRAFLNRLSINAQRYDAYIRFYVEPWRAQFENVRKLTETELGFDSSTKATP